MVSKASNRVELIVAQTTNSPNARRLMIPYLGVDYYRRIIHSDGRIEFIPQMVLDSNAEGVVSDKND